MSSAARAVKMAVEGDRGGLEMLLKLRPGLVDARNDVLSS